MVEGRFLLIALSGRLPPASAPPVILAHARISLLSGRRTAPNHRKEKGDSSFRWNDGKGERVRGSERASPPPDRPQERSLPLHALLTTHVHICACGTSGNPRRSGLSLGCNGEASLLMASGLMAYLELDQGARSRAAVPLGRSCSIPASGRSACTASPTGCSRASFTFSPGFVNHLARMLTAIDIHPGGADRPQLLHRPRLRRDRRDRRDRRRRHHLPACHPGRDQPARRRRRQAPPDHRGRRGHRLGRAGAGADHGRHRAPGSAPIRW